MPASASSRLAVKGIGSTARVYALAVLTLTYVLNFMDRYAIVAMAEHVKADLQLTDAQIGLLTGFAFSLVYACLGLPLAVLADRLGRVRVIAASVAMWSLMTALGSRSVSFATLALSRLGVGVGEAGGTPPAHAILSQMFAGRSLPLAIGIYSTGSGIGLALGLWLGGELANNFGWRNAMLLLGLPGLFVAPLVLFTVKEPAAKSSGTAPVFRAIPNDILRLFRTKQLLLLAAAMSFAAFVGFANLAWLTPLSVRRFGMDAPIVGVVGHTIGVGNILGVFFGGLIASVFEARTRQMSYWICASVACIAVPAFLASYLAQTDFVFVAGVALGVFSHSLMLAPVMTEAQRLVGVKDKALASAVLLFCINVFGAGAGAYAVGLVSDSLVALGPERSLTRALTFALPAYLVSAAIFLLAGRHFRNSQSPSANAF